MTPDNLKQVLTPKEMNVLQVTARKSMTADQKNAWASQKASRGGWLANFVLDPEEGMLRAMQKTVLVSQQGHFVEKVWLTEKQISEDLKSDEDARILVESGDLDERPHEHPSLAAKGRKQYHYRRTRQVDSETLTDEVAVENECELKPEEYAEIVPAMRKAFEQPQQKKPKGVAAKKPETEEMKQLKLARATRSTSLRKLKKNVEVFTNVLAADEVLADKVLQKGFPEQMKDFFLDKIAGAKQGLAPANQVYAGEIVKPDTCHETAEDLQASTATIDKAIASVEEAIKAWKKSTALDLARLTAADS